ncbi:DUF805 domain-containing protein [Massilia phosphatilytica]|nr:DUF805 domain-containing protein [Massilia phosphatilytica]
MTFIESIQTCFQKYASFDGTARRSEYWWFALFILIASLILGQISTTLSIVFSLATLLPSIAAATRRLHDTDRSGWWQLLYFLPLIGAIVLIVFLAQDSRPNRYGAAPAYAV